MCSAARNAAADTHWTHRPYGQPACKQQEKDTYLAATPPAFDGSLHGWPLEQLLSLHGKKPGKEPMPTATNGGSYIHLATMSQANSE